MKIAKPGHVTASVVLATIAAVVAVLPLTIITMSLDAVLIALLAAELDRSGRHVGLLLVRFALLLVPPRMRQDLADEWRDHVLTTGEQGLRPVLTAISIVWGGVRLALRYRVRRRAAIYMGEILLGLFEAVASAYKFVSWRNVENPTNSFWRSLVAYMAGIAAIPVGAIPYARKWVPAWVRIVIGLTILAGGEITAWFSTSTLDQAVWTFDGVIYISGALICAFSRVSPGYTKDFVKLMAGDDSLEL